MGVPLADRFMFSWLWHLLSVRSLTMCILDGSRRDLSALSLAVGPHNLSTCIRPLEEMLDFTVAPGWLPTCKRSSPYIASRTSYGKAVKIVVMLTGVWLDTS